MKTRLNKLGLSLAKLSNLFFKFGVGLVFAVKDRLGLIQTVNLIVTATFYSTHFALILPSGSPAGIRAIKLTLAFLQLNVV